MRAIPAKTPGVVKQLFPKRLWSVPDVSDTVYLTFDDGPAEDITPWVLEQLAKHNARATFFCIGQNAERNNTLLEQIIDEGHGIGNHTYHHFNGWKTSTEEYLEDVSRTGQLFKSPWFRPPYGKISGKQAEKVIKMGYQIVMWDVLSFDWDSELGPDKCLANVIDHIEPGSIVVFHDSLKAEKNLKGSLPKVLEYIKQRDWRCEVLPS